VGKETEGTKAGETCRGVNESFARQWGFSTECPEEMERSRAALGVEGKERPPSESSFAAIVG